jgi:hypothetical protein
VILDANATAAQQIGHCRHCLTAALSAGADGENKITEGKLLWLAEDLRVLFHAYVLLTANRVPTFIRLAFYMERACIARGASAD